MPEDRRKKAIILYIPDKQQALSSLQPARR